MRYIILLLSVLILINAETFCPAASDFMVTGGYPKLFDQGWVNIGSGGVATKASFNLLGGVVEYDIDVTNVKRGVNANIYTISPFFNGPYSNEAYCDAQKKDAQWCTEVDWLESNGACGGASTLHTRPGPGNDGCTAWGCQKKFMYNGRSKFHMKITYGADGSWTTVRDGVTISPSNLVPSVQALDDAVLREQYMTRGAVIISTQWVGWIPLEKECGDVGSEADAAASSFVVSNLKITGTVVQGPYPRVCGAPPPPADDCAGIEYAPGTSTNQWWLQVLVSTPRPSVSIKCADNKVYPLYYSKYGPDQLDHPNLPSPCPGPRVAIVNGRTCGIRDSCEVEYVAGTADNKWWLQLRVGTPLPVSVWVKCANGMPVKLNPSKYGEDQMDASPTFECAGPRVAVINGRSCPIKPARAAAAAIGDTTQNSDANGTSAVNPLVYGLVACGVALVVLVVVVVVLTIKLSRRIRTKEEHV